MRISPRAVMKFRRHFSRRHGNFIKTNLDITFTDDSAWRNAVTAVKVNGNTLTQDTQYELSEENCG